MSKLKKSLLLAFVAFAAINAEAQQYAYKWTADKGNGTFVNPIVNGDFPDCDVIRVGDTFYFVSTTMYHFPGATLLKSKDLVNWEYCANPLLQIENNDAYNLLNGGSHYAQGMWASSLNYHDGKFYIYFISYGRNGYDSGRNILLTATDPEGEWKMEYWPEHYYDAGWLFDDGENGDGYLYVACGIGNIYINKLNSKTLAKISSTQVVYNKDGYEGSHMYHIGDFYYLYVTTGGYWKGQTIYRSKNPMGPYEEVPYTLFQGDAIHQGALVDTPTGEWWTVMFKDAGAIGRVPNLEPVKWVDGWPVIGDMVDGKGRDVCRAGKAYPKPRISDDEAVQNADYRTYLPTNDAFSTPTLGKQWQWNHNPQTMAWSLTDRPGWMRLYSCTVTDNVVSARGSLSQRIIGLNGNGTASSSYTNCFGVTKMDISGMQEGDVAGLAVWSNPLSFIGVKVKDGKKYLYSQRCTFNSQIVAVAEEKTGTAINGDVIYLRAVTNFGTNKCNYFYSINGSTWSSFGVSMSMNYTLDFFVGQRYYLFNYSTKATGGYVDFDWFTTEKEVPTEAFAKSDEDSKGLFESEEAEGWVGFPLDKEYFTENVIGGNTLVSKSLKCKANGLSAWIYPKAWDVSDYKYLVVRMRRAPLANVPAYVYVYDQKNIWSAPYKQALKSTVNAIDLNNMVNEAGVKINPANIRIVGFCSTGEQTLYLEDAFLSMDGVNQATGIETIQNYVENEACYDLTGRKVANPTHGFYIKGGNKYVNCR